MEISLDGHVVVITGGAKRLGRIIAFACAASGAEVAITYRSSRDEALDCVAALQKSAPGRRFAAYPCEVSSAAQVKALTEDVVRDFGFVSDLVNSAAIFRRTPFAELTESDFDDHIASNLKGPYLTCKAFGDLFLERGAGSIVNFGDIYGERPLANYLPYCLSKAGVIMLTQSIAKALAPKVRCNCVCPGTILPPSEPQDESAGPPLQRIPFGRMGTPEEIAATVVFLLGGPAFITGAILPVDGGQILT